MSISVKLPVKIISEANTRSHWREKARRASGHRSAAHGALLRYVGVIPPCGERFAITLTRIAPRELDDDNLAGGFKAVRDGVADWLGIDDGSKRLTWRYEQRKGWPREYAAEIKIEMVN